MPIPAYVINLKSRIDRRVEFEDRHDHLKLDFEFVEAVDGTLIEPSSQSSPRNVAACWLSHQKVAELFLSTQNEFALVLEDDAVLDFRTINLVRKEYEFSTLALDLFQVGYNIQANRVASGHRDSHLRLKLTFLCFVQRFLAKIPMVSSNLCKTHKIHNTLKLPEPCVSDLFETGTHAYIMSRRAAQLILEFNNPVILPADVALCELAKTSYVSMARPSRTYSMQSNSVSSILEISNEVMETKIAEVAERITNDYRH